MEFCQTSNQTVSKTNDDVTVCADNNGINENDIINENCTSQSKDDHTAHTEEKNNDSETPNLSNDAASVHSDQLLELSQTSDENAINSEKTSTDFEWTPTD